VNDLAYKFTDEDLRRDPNLYYAATEFLGEYKGDFGFLRQAQQSMRLGELTHGVVRGVLNCMRTHPVGVHMLPQDSTGLFVPASAPVQCAPIPSEEFDYLRDRRKPPLWLVRQNRPARIYMKCRFKAEYFLSMHKQAFRAHLLNPASSAVVWFPHTGELKVQPEPYCSVHLSFGVMSLELHGRDVCRQCTLIKESRT
jgi:hypothetical protein